MKKEENKITDEKIEKLAGAITRVFYPTYDEAASGIKRSLKQKKVTVEAILFRWCQHYFNKD